MNGDKGQIGITGNIVSSVFDKLLGKLKKVSVDEMKNGNLKGLSI